MCSYEKARDAGVSPVVGVMLMLVVTIIIAAVVSAFSGGLAAGQKAPPGASMEIHLRNDGTGNSFFMIKVLSVSEPIPTRDLKIVTSWTNASGGKGGATILPNINNTYYHSYPSGSYATAISPAGYGPGVSLSAESGSVTYRPSSANYFGNYSLTSGTTMINWPPNYGSPAPSSITNPQPYKYWDTWTDYVGFGGSEVDSFTAMLGVGWNTLRAGDKLHVKIFHVPSGKTIVDQDVIVEG